LLFPFRLREQGKGPDFSFTLISFCHLSSAVCHLLLRNLHFQAVGKRRDPDAAAAGRGQPAAIPLFQALDDPGMGKAEGAVSGAGYHGQFRFRQVQEQRGGRSPGTVVGNLDDRAGQGRAQGAGDLGFDGFFDVAAEQKTVPSVGDAQNHGMIIASLRGIDEPGRRQAIDGTGSDVFDKAALNFPE